MENIETQNRSGINKWWFKFKLWNKNKVNSKEHTKLTNEFTIHNLTEHIGSLSKNYSIKFAFVLLVQMKALLTLYHVKLLDFCFFTL